MSRSILEAINITWNTAFNSGDIKGLVSLYAEDAILSPGDGKVLVGREEIEKLFNSFIDGGVHDHTLEIVESGATDNMMYQVARWGAKGAETNGETPAFGGITTNVLQKNAEGQWLTKTHIWNANQ